MKKLKLKPNTAFICGFLLTMIIAGYWGYLTAKFWPGIVGTTVAAVGGLGLGLTRAGNRLLKFLVDQNEEIN